MLRSDPYAKTKWYYIFMHPELQPSVECQAAKPQANRKGIEVALTPIVVICAACVNQIYFLSFM